MNLALPKRFPRPPAALAMALAIPRRRLHLAPPFLLDDGYMPRYQQLSSVDAAKKRSLAYAHLRNCNLCPRQCGVNRYEKTGMCLIGHNVKVSVIAPHFGEGMDAFSATRLPDPLALHIDLSSWANLTTLLLALDRAVHPRPPWQWFCLYERM